MLPQPGTEIDLGRWALERQDVDAYLSATQDSSTIYASLSIVPPLALVAYILKEILERLSLPPGTLHATQEVKCLKGVPIGAEVRATARFARPLQRGEWQFIPANFTLWGADTEMTLTGRTTVIVSVKNQAIA